MELIKKEDNSKLIEAHMMNVSKKSKILSKVIFYLILTIFLVFFSYPIYLILMASFKTPMEIFGSPFSFPKEILLGNYLKAWEKIRFGLVLKNSVIMTICSITLLIIFGSMAAYFCAKNKSKASNYIFLIFISCIIVPFHTAMIPVVKFISMIHLNNTYLGVIMVYVAINLSFTVFIYTGFMKGIPVELEEAAIVDGCTRFGVFWRIIFPLTIPVTATVAILNSLSIWNDFLINLLLISSPSRRNIPSALFAFQGQYNNQWDLMFASMILSIIPILLLYVVLQKYIIKGVTQGAVKG